MLTFRKPRINDSRLYFNWTNDEEVRAKSFSSQLVTIEEHDKWFKNKLKNKNCLMLVFQDEHGGSVGQTRIQKQAENQSIMGISISSEFRGLGYAKEMLIQASELFLKANPDFTIHAYIKESNLTSKYAFEKAGYQFKEMLNYENFNSFHYIKIK